MQNLQSLYLMEFRKLRCKMFALSHSHLLEQADNCDVIFSSNPNIFHILGGYLEWAKLVLKYPLALTSFYNSRISYYFTPSEKIKNSRNFSLNRKHYGQVDGLHFLCFIKWSSHSIVAALYPFGNVLNIWFFSSSW